ncbi:DUF192 domain-containing protein [Pararhizobium sp. BT-229]|uniref:DUF192 domain-containing protein n=1 Tax=Pararhizobium sp. BT-229 TaxID=2986923 RepID=UPI0021F69DBE|nr:DUF192 domain-containing protein [Pararhizobium sp. BT-229]MCV9965236.1 DUF192 domain-containing protein [Pararhizobium sp. BT-229]
MLARFPRRAGSALVALFLWLVPFHLAAADITFDTAPLQIITAGGKVHKFTVELALDSEQRAQGLMNRRHMPRDRGMLFDFGQTRQVMMWMKDTYLPLDMLFIARDGRIETVRENAVPLSEAIIDSRVPVAFVLELNAGTASRLGIAPGDVVDSPPISRTKP